MTSRALAVWCLLLLLAVLNGGVRDAWLSPRLGDPIGRAISTLLLCGLILLATWLTIGWIQPTSSGAALGVGALWVVLTLAFSGLFGTTRAFSVYLLSGLVAWNFFSQTTTAAMPWATSTSCR